MQPGQNLEYLLVAFGLVWLVFFGYAVVLARQVVQLRHEVEDLRGEAERRGQG
ncbi:MAG: CcmD family protein [Chloroflexi bacterium]|nr:CcmD family protein [Chloroflexota bacterium]